MFNTLLFYFFSSFILISAIMVISATNALYSVFFLILVFCNATFILLLLNVEFLALTLILVYIGAVAVLFLFVVMMLDIKEINKNEKNIFFSLPINIIIGIIILSEIYLILFNDLTLNLTPLTNRLEFENWFNFINPISNLEAIGQILYTYYFIYFIQAGIVLLIAMIGSIVLTMQFNKFNKRQQISEQISRQVSKSYFLIKQIKK
jgi:NADH-quinone oxidoreductase subunit J